MTSKKLSIAEIWERIRKKIPPKNKIIPSNKKYSRKKLPKPTEDN